MPSDQNDPTPPEPNSLAVIHQRLDTLKRAVLALADVCTDLLAGMNDTQRQVDILSHPPTETIHDPRD